MNSVFRSASPGPSDYAALAFVLGTFLAVMCLIIAPKDLLSNSQGQAVSQP